MCRLFPTQAAVPSAPVVPLACAFGRMHQEMVSLKFSVAKQDNLVEMRGPRIMRNISKLLAEKVCCSCLLCPKRKV